MKEMMKETWEKYFLALENDWPKSRRLSANELVEARDWCKKNCTGDWYSFGDRVYVKESKDAMFILLKWS